MLLFSQRQLQEQIEQMGILPSDTLLIHSSMKAIGEVEGGADTVLDAFMDYLHKGLLVLPTHTWKQINDEYNVFDVLHEPSCVGILTNIFRQRPGVIRSWHPTHSVAAYGKDAAEYTRGEEQHDTPCPRAGCYGKLYDRGAKILFIGCGLDRNTTIHGVEEWNQIPNRISSTPQELWIRTPHGEMIHRPMYQHYCPIGDVSANYGKLEAPLLALGFARRGTFGRAASIVVDVVPMVDLTTAFLKRNPDLFIDDSPVPPEWYTVKGAS
ncbi:MAG: AAC(3) family N-acetyltransferase [Firmicutes bacterium]|nr:AAC(3) family N-acetyltransferase [Bacillota bacterium]